MLLAVGESTVSFGDRVLIRTAPETEHVGFAGREGIVYGWTTPSVTNVGVIGEPAEDLAYNVGFDEPGSDAWFAPHLVEMLDHSPGLEITVGEQRLVRDAEGAWRKRRKSLFRRWQA